MVALKFLAMALAGLAGGLGVAMLFDIGTDRGSNALGAYGRWISDELDKVQIEVTPARASAWVIVMVMFAAVLGALAGNNFGQRIFWIIVLCSGAYFMPNFAVSWLQSRY